MKAAQVVWALGPIDAKSIGRDSMLRWLALYPLALALIVRWGVPALTVKLRASAGFDLVPYYPLVMSFVLLAVPTISGVMIGFLLLDQRDDETLTALRVTPLPLRSYLVYRVATPVALGSVGTLVALPLTGLLQMDFVALLAVTLEAALLAPLYAIFLAAFATNKVQGFALAKGAGILMWPAILAYFVVDSGWQLACSFSPLYWPAKLYWVLDAGEPNAWLYFGAGIAYQSLLLALLMRRYNTTIQR